MNSMNNHHAVLLRVLDIETFDFEPTSPKVEKLLFRQQQLGIADVRKLIDTAHRTPAQGAERQELIVVTNFITIEAQQALLKVIEEPPSTTSFLFVVPTSLQLLPTLRSRFVEEFQGNTSISATCNLDPFTAFMEANMKERMEQIETATKQKDETWQIDIRCGLIKHVEQNPGLYTKEKLASLGYVISTLQTRGASNKMLLEELALTL